MALFARNEPVLGIDISPSAIKLIELSRSGTRFRVESFAVERIGEHMIEDRNPVDTDEMADAIRRACKKAGTKLRRAATAIPTTNVITRTVPVPGEFKERDIENNIAIEAAQYIPYPIEEVYLDFEMKGPSQTAPDSQDIMLVATRKENVDTRDATLRNAGLLPSVVDVEAYALENTFRLVMDQFFGPTAQSSEAVNTQKARDSLVALVDIGMKATTLYILQEDKIIFNREQSFGSDQLTGYIADAMNVSKEQAEQMKRSGQTSEEIEAVLYRFKQTVTEQIANSLQFFYSSDLWTSGSYYISHILLMGGGAMVIGLDRVAAETLGMNVSVLNPFKNMASAARVNSAALLRDAPLLAVACGLALRSFDQ